MIGTLFILFIVLPFVELYILIELGSSIGTLPTLGIVVLTGIAGAALAKHQGLSVLRRIQTEMSFGQMPEDVIFDGVLVLIGAVLLITPGILTDTTGFLLLIPVTRKIFKKYLKVWVNKKIKSGQMVYYTQDNYHM
ncbi:MAG: phage T7 F exclusion suppressor FxsA [ANME-2 cluster archaeon HR1]|nr:MAG: phage T7 F exclusion suppressor FxsA [ANME-2 cluster archaeon HR1]